MVATAPLPTTPRSTSAHGRLRDLSGALLAALAAQWLLTRGSTWIDGTLVYAIAILLFVRFLRAAEPALGSAAPPAAGVGADFENATGLSPRLARFLVTVLAVTGFFSLGGNAITPQAAVALLLAIGLYIWLGWRQSLPSLPRFRLDRVPWSRSGIRVRLGWWAVAALSVVALACVFRFYQLAEIPREMISDHAEKFLDIQTIQQGARPIFFPRNAGREGTQFYLASALANITGYTYLTLKLPTVVASLLSVPAVGGLGWVLFGRWVGLTAAFLLAISKWDVAVARFATRAAFGELWAAACLALAYWGIRRQSHLAFLFLGLAMGAGIYGYTSFRIVPVFIGLALTAFVLFDPVARAQRRVLIRWAVQAYGLAGLFVLPLARYAVDYPQDFLFRSASRLTESETALRDAAPRIFVENVGNMVLMFNWRGDRSWLTSVPNEPSLDWVTGAFFVLGVVFATYRVVRRRDVLAATLVGGIFVLTLPSTLALAFPVENPHLSRGNPVLPFVMVLAAIPPVLLLQAARDSMVRPALRWAMVAGFAVCGLLAVVANFESYFVDYAGVHQRNSQNQREVAAVIHGFAELTGSDRGAYLPVWPFWVDHRLVALELGDFSWKDGAVLDRMEQAETQARTPGPKLYILHQDDEVDLQALLRIYPDAIVQLHVSAKEGRSFRSVFVPR
jgi:hypothetical protein